VTRHSNKPGNGKHRERPKNLNDESFNEDLRKLRAEILEEPIPEALLDIINADFSKPKNKKERLRVL
jgi:hypothetical protein